MNSNNSNQRPHCLRVWLATEIFIIASANWLGRAQTLETVYSFTGVEDGSAPRGLCVSGNTIYGTTYQGGIPGEGTVFRVNTDGTSLTILHAFDLSALDGASPIAGLVLSNNVLYGTTYQGGQGSGTIFRIGSDGADYRRVHNFTPAMPPNWFNIDGAWPSSDLILVTNVLYGTTRYGGSGGAGTVFRVNTDGSDFRVLRNFPGGAEGANPIGGLVLCGNTLFGTTTGGGSPPGNGTVFKVDLDGTAFAVLHRFTATPPYPGPFTNLDGAGPSGALVSSGQFLYGVAASGGTAGHGTIFRLQTDGTGFTNLYSIGAEGPLSITNSEGHYPTEGLLLVDRKLYGTTDYGGRWGCGTAFKIGLDGTGFETLHTFTGASDGCNPNSPLVQSGTVLYGTAGGGGTYGEGVIFAIPLVSGSAPTLALLASVTNVVLMWPTNVTGYVLQTTTNTLGPAGWYPVSPGPVVANGQNVVTNSMANAAQFYRLSR